MAKIPFDDVVPPERKRSIRNVPIRPRKGKVNVHKMDDVAEADLVDTHKEVPPPTKTTVPPPRNPSYYTFEERGEPPRKRRRLIFGFVAVLVILAFVATMMTVFASANLVVIPKTEKFNVELTIDASPHTGDKLVHYEVVKLSQSKSATVPAEGEENVERKASGTIIVYNNFSPEPQRLITRTRFESANGNIYRIAESIIVPGKTDAGPGAIETTVYADEAGEKYNSDKTDFKIPGFKNDAARYSGFYARSKTNIEGGFIGKVKKVEESARVAALTQLETSLKEDLVRELNVQLPDNLILLDGAVMYEFRELPQKDDSNAATLTKEGTAYALLLDRNNLSTQVAGAALNGAPTWSEVPAMVSDFKDLKVASMPTSLEAGNAIKLKVIGDAHLRADIDIVKIKQSLSGIKRDSISEAMKAYPGILSVRATIRPIWKSSFPDRTDKIYVELAEE